jgi:hypothetical protein
VGSGVRPGTGAAVGAVLGKTVGIAVGDRVGDTVCGTNGTVGVAGAAVGCTVDASVGDMVCGINGSKDGEGAPVDSEAGDAVSDLKGSVIGEVLDCTVGDKAGPAVAVAFGELCAPLMATTRTTVTAITTTVKEKTPRQDFMATYAVGTIVAKSKGSSSFSSSTPTNTVPKLERPETSPMR